MMDKSKVTKEPDELWSADINPFLNETKKDYKKIGRASFMDEFSLIIQRLLNKKKD